MLSTNAKKVHPLVAQLLLIDNTTVSGMREIKTVLLHSSKSGFFKE